MSFFEGRIFMGWLFEKVLDEIYEKYKGCLSEEQYKKRIEASEQNIKDFLIAHYGETYDFDEIDAFITNYNVLPQLISWSLREDVSVYKETEKLLDSVKDSSLSKNQLKKIVINLFSIAYEEITKIDDPGLKNAVIKINNSLQAFADETEKHLQKTELLNQELCRNVEIIRQENRELRKSLEDMKAILLRLPALSGLDIESRLKKAFDTEKNHNPSIDYENPSEELVPTIHLGTSDIEVTPKADKTLSMQEVFSHSWESSLQNHICITGTGGIGKTVCILETDYPVPAIYIPLRYFFEIGTEEYIQYYIREVTLQKAEYYNDFIDICSKEWLQGPNIIIILDGVNELDPPKVNRIFNELNMHWLKLPGIQFIITSRYEVETKLGGADTVSVSVNRLSKKKIAEYLKNNNLDAPRDQKIWKIIDTPLNLKLYLCSEIIKKKRECRFADWKEIPNAGNVIWNYFQSELAKSNISQHNAVTALFFVAPFVAHSMVKNNQFVLKNSVFRRLIKQAIIKYVDLDEQEMLPQIIEKSKEENYNSEIDRNKIFNILTRQLNLVAHKGDEIQFVHQNFRDCLCAVYLIQIAENAENIPDEWTEVPDSNIESYLSDLLQTKDHSPRLWEKIWSMENDAGEKPEQFIRFMLHLFYIMHGEDISDIDFSGIDLTNICLSDYKLTSKSRRHFVKTRLSRGTFFGKGHYLTVSAVSWSCKGNFYISASHDCSIRIHGRENDVDIELPSYHSHYIRCAECSPKDERVIVSAGDDRELVLWKCSSDLFDKNQWTHHVLGKCSAWIRTLDWSWDGGRIACGNADGSIDIFSINGERISFERHHDTQVRCIKWSDADNMLISGDENGIICIWHCSGRLLTQILPSKEDSCCTGVNWVDCGRFIVSWKDSARLYRIIKTDADQAVECYMQEELPLHGVTLTTVCHREEFIFLTAFCKNNIEVRRMYLKENGGALVDSLVSYDLSNDFNAVFCVAQLFEGGILQMICGARDGSIGRISVNTEEEAGDRITIQQIGIKCNQSARCSAWSPDGKLLAVGYDDCRIRIWEVFQRRCLMVLEGHEDSVKCVTWLPDGKIVSGSDDNSIRMWKKNQEGGYSGEKIYSHSGPVNSIISLHNGTILAGGDDCRISITVFSKKGEPTTRLLEKVHQKRIYSLAVYPKDENIIASGGNDNFICLWNLRTGEKHKYSAGHDAAIRTLCWSKDGRLLISSSNDCSVAVRDFCSKKTELCEDIEKLEPILDDFIYGASVSGNDKYIVGGCTDFSVIFWNKEDRKCVLHNHYAHQNFVWHVGESPEIGKNYYVATSSSDGTVKIWNTTNEIAQTADYTLPVIPNSNFTGCDFYGAVISDESLAELMVANGGRNMWKKK